jgi:glutaredoxin 3
MITIYSTPTCAFCHMVKEYLKDKDITYTERDITKDEEGMHWVLNNTGQLAVPVTDIDGTIIVGFDRPRIDEALREKAYIA